MWQIQKLHIWCSSAASHMGSYFFWQTFGTSWKRCRKFKGASFALCGFVGCIFSVAGSPPKDKEVSLALLELRYTFFDLLPRERSKSELQKRRLHRAAREVVDTFQNSLMLKESVPRTELISIADIEHTAVTLARQCKPRKWTSVDFEIYLYDFNCLFPLNILHWLSSNWYIWLLYNMYVDFKGYKKWKNQ